MAMDINPNLDFVYSKNFHTFKVTNTDLSISVVVSAAGKPSEIIDRAKEKIVTTLINLCIEKTRMIKKA